MQLKIAAMLLFWFGVVYQFSAIISIPSEYYIHNTIQGARAVVIFSYWLFVLEGFIYPLFAHVAHIIAGYLLAKGNKIGAVAGITIGVWEIGGYLTFDINETLTKPVGTVFLIILFAIVILLIISGRKEIASLKSENWRPWKNPRVRGD